MLVKICRAYFKAKEKLDEFEIISLFLLFLRWKIVLCDAGLHFCDPCRFVLTIEIQTKKDRQDELAKKSKHLKHGVAH